VAICLFDAIVALNVSKKKKNEYFCIFLSLSIYCRCFGDVLRNETMFSGPRRFFRRYDFCNTVVEDHRVELPSLVGLGMDRREFTDCKIICF
jgi:hypothetical protein